MWVLIVWLAGLLKYFINLKICRFQLKLTDWKANLIISLPSLAPHSPQNGIQVSLKAHKVQPVAQSSFLPPVMVWMFVPPSPIHEDLTPNKIGFGGGAFGKWLGLDEVMRVEPLWWDECPYEKRRRDQSSLSTPCETTMRRQPSASQGELSPDTESTGPLILDFPASRTVRNKCLRYHIIIAALSQPLLHAFWTAMLSLDWMLWNLSFSISPCG